MMVMLLCCFFYFVFQQTLSFSICPLHRISSLRSHDSEWKGVKEWHWHNEKPGVMPGVVVAFPGTNEQSKVCWYFPHLYFVVSVCPCAGYCLFHKGTKTRQMIAVYITCDIDLSFLGSLKLVAEHDILY